MSKELPKGWATATLDELCDINPKHDRLLSDKLEISFVPMAAVSDVLGEIVTPEIKVFSDVRKGFTQFADGDVVWAKITPCMENGKSAVVKKLKNGLGCGTTEFYVLRTRGAVEPHYLHRFMRQESYRQSAKATMQSGVGQARVPKEFIQNSSLPIPPLNEQKRIVKKIEYLQARSKRAREALESIPPLIEKFRQSVLASAFRGDLTKEWREKNKDKIEPASELLKRIRIERRKKWEEEQLKKFEASGKKPKDDQWKEEYKESEKAHLWGSGATRQHIDESWGSLPESWQWVKVRELNVDPALTVQIGPMSMKSNEFTETGVRVLNVGTVRWGSLDLEKCDYLPSQRAADFSRYQVSAGDVLFTRSGTVGRSAVVPPGFAPALMTFHLLRVRTSNNICVPDFLYFLFRGCPSIKMQTESSQIGGTRAGFNTRLLEEMWIPLPPIEEQKELLTILSRAAFKENSILSLINDLTMRLDQLDQSILAKAFRGELVPQDPNDEPAEVLLERIKKERGEKEASKTRSNLPKAKRQAGKNTSARTLKAKKVKENIVVESEVGA